MILFRFFKYRCLLEIDKFVRAKRLVKFCSRVNCLKPPACYSSDCWLIWLLTEEQKFAKRVLRFNPFHVTGLFVHPLKYQKARVFLIFLGGIERE